MEEMLVGMFPDLSRSVIAAVVPDARGDVERAVLTLRAFQGDPVQEERQRLAALPEAQKMDLMRNALGTTFPDDTLRAALRATNGDVTAAINRLFSTSALPVAPQPQPQPQPQRPAPAPVSAPAPVVHKKPPLDDMSIEERVRKEQEEALRRAQASKKPPQPAPAPAPAPTKPQPQPITASVMQRVETAAKARELSLERHIAELTKQLSEAETRLVNAREELGSAQRLRVEEVSRAREEAEAREIRANLEKEQIAKRLEETRTQLEHLQASTAAVSSEAAAATTAPLSPESSASSSSSTSGSMPSLAPVPEIRCKLEGSCTSADTITFHWDAAGLPLSATDWVGLFIHNRQFSNKYTKYHCTKGQPAGEGRFTGLLPGMYDLRFFLAGTPRETKKYGPILVGTGVDIRVSFEGIGSKREIRVSWDAQVAMSTANDWVGLFSAATLSNKKYIAYQYVSGFSSLVFAAPREPGAYSVRYFRAGSGYCFSGWSLVMVPNDDKLEVVPSSKPGNVRVQWQCFSADSARGDWVGIFDSADPAATRLGWSYTSTGRAPEGDHGVVDVSVNATPVANALWEVRFFATSLPKDKQPHLRFTFTPVSK